MWKWSTLERAKMYLELYNAVEYLRVEHLERWSIYRGSNLKQSNDVKFRTSKNSELREITEVSTALYDVSVFVLESQIAGSMV